MNSYLCDYGNCEIQKPASKMIYLRLPTEARRFCSREHLVLWVKENLEK